MSLGAVFGVRQLVCHAPYQNQHSSRPAPSPRPHASLSTFPCLASVHFPSFLPGRVFREGRRLTRTTWNTAALRKLLQNPLKQLAWWLCQVTLQGLGTGAHLSRSLP